MPSSVAGPASKRRRKDSVPSGAKTPTKRQASAAAAAAAASAVAADSGAGTEESKPGDRDVHSTVVMVQVPGDFSLSQAACSYGYFLVPPNLWQPSKETPELKDTGTFSRPLRFGKRLQNTARCVISQPSSRGKASPTRGRKPARGSGGGGGGGGGGGSSGGSRGRGGEGGPAVAELRVEVASTVALTESDRHDIRSQVERMFQTTIDLEPWFRLSPEAKKSGYGRLFRSPTVFEDMVKSITGCNMKFQGTIRMNKLLCEEFGRDQAFPTPEDLEGVKAEDLKEKAKVGYRGDRILRLAQSFRDGTVDPQWLEAPERTREEVMKFVKGLHGFGDYAASNVVMLLGYYEEVPLDSETVRHFKDYHGITTKNVKEVAVKAKRQYEAFAPYQFLQYWYEMITWHQKKRGAEVHLWDPADVASY